MFLIAFFLCLRLHFTSLFHYIMSIVLFSFYFKSLIISIIYIVHYCLGAVSTLHDIYTRHNKCWWWWLLLSSSRIIETIFIQNCHFFLLTIHVSYKEMDHRAFIDAFCRRKMSKLRATCSIGMLLYTVNVGVFVPLWHKKFHIFYL